MLSGNPTPGIPDPLVWQSKTMVEPTFPIDPIQRLTTPTQHSESSKHLASSRFYDPALPTSSSPTDHIDKDGVLGAAAAAVAAVGDQEWDELMASSNNNTTNTNNNNRRRSQSSRRGLPALQSQQSQPPLPHLPSSYGPYSPATAAAATDSQSVHRLHQHYYSQRGAPAGYNLGPPYGIPHQPPPAQAFTPAPPYTYAAYDLSPQNYHLHSYSYPPPPPEQQSSPYRYHHQPSPPPPQPQPQQPGPSTTGQSSPSPTAYSSQGGYQSLRFSPQHSPQYGYPAHSFTTSPPATMYSTQYPSYPSPQEGQQAGTWWYMPPTAAQTSYDPEQAGYYPSISHQQQQPQAQQQYPTLAPLDVDSSTLTSPISVQSPGQPSPSSSHLAHQQAQSHSHLLPSSGMIANSPRASSRPDLSPIQAVRSERQPIRRPHHPNPPAYRSEWVMWVGNVPSDATHDELWRFFGQTTPSPLSSSSASSSQSTTLATASTTTRTPITTASSSRTPSSQLLPLSATISSISPRPGGTSTLGSPRLTSDSPPLGAGLLSIFLISRSSCAFVNLASEAHLHASISRFHGLSLRPQDPRVPKLVCRVRRKDDDLKAGVGGQRGIGLHAKWIKEKAKEQAIAAISDLDARMVGLALSDDELRQGTPVAGGSGGAVPAGMGSGSSGSYASTNSSILVRHFPKRYFILKSLTQYDLDLSVEKGLWATQKHNEGILDKAFRTSTDVYLIFGVNKSGAFYGYARMAGPIHRGEERVSWATRTTDSSSSARSSISVSPVTGRGPIASETIHEEESEKGYGSGFFSPGHQILQESPLPVPTPELYARNKLAPSPTQRSSRFGSGALGDEGPMELESGPSPGQRLLQQLDQSAGGALLDGVIAGATTAPGSAPAILGPHRSITSSTISSKRSLDVVKGRARYPHPTSMNTVDLEAAANERAGDFELDQSELMKRMKRPDGTASVPILSEETGAALMERTASGNAPQQQLRAVSEEEEAPAHLLDSSVARDFQVQHVIPTPSTPPPMPLEPTAEQQPDQQQQQRDDETWGESFKIEWLCTKRLPFHRTRHIRNPWNHDREVKVSRDGTEIEPTAGQMLLDEWEKEPPSDDEDSGGAEGGGGGVAIAGGGGGGGGGGGVRGGRRGSKMSGAAGGGSTTMTTAPAG